MAKKYRKKAAALSYTPPQAAPILLVSGTGKEAEAIIKEALKAGIAIIEDPGLAAMLEKVKPGDYIPPWCWEAVAKILSFVYAMEKETVETH